MTCRTCVDYTNVLADITVGYMGGQGEQWLLVVTSAARNCLACWERKSGFPNRKAPANASDP